MRLEKWPLINRPAAGLQLSDNKGSVGGVGGRGIQGVRKVRSFWSNGFSGSIVIGDRTLRPGRKLQGKVVIHSKALVTFVGLRVQLDAQCTLFLEKGGELVTKRFSILQTDNHPNNGMNNAQHNINNGRRGGGGGSSIQCEAVDSLINSKEIYALIPDINSVVDANTFPFSLEIPGDRSFPAPFNNSCGSLVYKLSAHLCSQDLRYVQISEEVLDFKGYLNLIPGGGDPPSKSIYIERPHPLLQGTQSEEEAKASKVRASFQVESSGFLSEEAVHFVLSVSNPRRMPMHMRVFVTQKIMYGIAENCWKRVTCTAVRCERAEVNIPADGEVVWKGALILPKGQVPSFVQPNCANNAPSYSVTYNIQFKVEGIEHDWCLKGTAPLFMGTCRNGFYSRLITG